jgi:hypothetical protein
MPGNSDVSADLASQGREFREVSADLSMVGRMREAVLHKLSVMPVLAVHLCMETLLLFPLVLLLNRLVSPEMNPAFFVAQFPLYGLAGYLMTSRGSGKRREASWRQMGEILSSWRYAVPLRFYGKDGILPGGLCGRRAPSWGSAPEGLFFGAEMSCFRSRSFILLRCYI